MARSERPAGGNPPAGSIARSLLAVGGATVVAQGALVMAAPVLARLYDPETFGLLSIYAAVIAVLLAASSLRFDQAVPIASEPAEALHLVALCVVLALVASIVLGLIVAAWGDDLTATIGVPSLAPLAFLLPIALFVASVAQAMAAWAVYARTFGALARMKALQGVTQAVCQIALGVSHLGAFGLLAGDLVGRLAGTEQLLSSLSATMRTTRLSLAAIGRCARERWGFARVMAAASVLNALSLQVPFLLIPSLFDLESSGQYFLAYRLLILPASLVAAAVSQVFFGEAAFRRGDPARLHDLALNSSVSLFVFSIPTYSIVAVAGPALIALLFGPEWSPAGLYARLMAPWLMLWSVASPISSLLLVGRRERESLAFTVAELTLKTGALAVGAVAGSLVVGLVVLTLVSIAINIAALWRFLRVARVRLLDLARPAARILALTAPWLAAVAVVAVALPAGAMATVAVCLAAGCGWLLSVGLALRFSPEPRALLSAGHD